MKQKKEERKRAARAQGSTAGQRKGGVPQAYQQSKAKPAPTFQRYEYTPESNFDKDQVRLERERRARRELKVNLKRSHRGQGGVNATYGQDATYVSDPLLDARRAKKLASTDKERRRAQLAEKIALAKEIERLKALEKEKEMKEVESLEKERKKWENESRTALAKAETKKAVAEAEKTRNQAEILKNESDTEQFNKSGKEQKEENVDDDDDDDDDEEEEQEEEDEVAKEEETAALKRRSKAEAEKERVKNAIAALKAQKEKLLADEAYATELANAAETKRLIAVEAQKAAAVAADEKRVAAVEASRINEVSANPNPNRN